MRRYPITITAHNGAGPDATQSFTLTVTERPAITSANHTTFTVGAAGTFTVTATGAPRTVGERKLSVTTDQVRRAGSAGSPRTSVSAAPTTAP